MVSERIESAAVLEFKRVQNENKKSPAANAQTKSEVLFSFDQFHVPIPFVLAPHLQAPRQQYSQKPKHERANFNKSWNQRCPYCGFFLCLLFAYIVCFLFAAGANGVSSRNGVAQTSGPTKGNTRAPALKQRLAFAFGRASLFCLLMRICGSTRKNSESNTL